MEALNDAILHTLDSLRFHQPENRIEVQASDEVKSERNDEHSIDFLSTGNDTLPIIREVPSATTIETPTNPPKRRKTPKNTPTRITLPIQTSQELLAEFSLLEWLQRHELEHYHDAFSQNEITTPGALVSLVPECFGKMLGMRSIKERRRLEGAIQAMHDAIQKHGHRFGMVTTGQTQRSPQRQSVGGMLATVRAAVESQQTQLSTQQMTQLTFRGTQQTQRLRRRLKKESAALFSILETLFDIFPSAEFASAKENAESAPFWQNIHQSTQCEATEPNGTPCTEWSFSACGSDKQTAPPLWQVATQIDEIPDLPRLFIDACNAEIQTEVEKQVYSIWQRTHADLANVRQKLCESVHEAVHAFQTQQSRILETHREEIDALRHATQLRIVPKSSAPLSWELAYPKECTASVRLESVNSTLQKERSAFVHKICAAAVSTRSMGNELYGIVNIPPSGAHRPHRCVLQKFAVYQSTVGEAEVQFVNSEIAQKDPSGESNAEMEKLTAPKKPFKDITACESSFDYEKFANAHDVFDDNVVQPEEHGVYSQQFVTSQAKEVSSLNGNKSQEKCIDYAQTDSCFIESEYKRIDIEAIAVNEEVQSEGETKINGMQVGAHQMDCVKDFACVEGIDDKITRQLYCKDLPISAEMDRLSASEKVLHLTESVAKISHIESLGIHENKNSDEEGNGQSTAQMNQPNSDGPLPPANESYPKPNHMENFSQTPEEADFAPEFLTQYDPMSHLLGQKSADSDDGLFQYPNNFSLEDEETPNHSDAASLHGSDCMANCDGIVHAEANLYQSPSPKTTVCETIEKNESMQDTKVPDETELNLSDFATIGLSQHIQCLSASLSLSIGTHSSPNHQNAYSAEKMPNFCLNKESTVVQTTSLQGALLQNTTTANFQDFHTPLRQSLNLADSLLSPEHSFSETPLLGIFHGGYSEELANVSLPAHLYSENNSPLPAIPANEQSVCTPFTHWTKAMLRTECQKNGLKTGPSAEMRARLHRLWARSLSQSSAFGSHSEIQAEPLSSQISQNASQNGRRGVKVSLEQLMHVASFLMRTRTPRDAAALSTVERLLLLEAVTPVEMQIAVRSLSVREIELLPANLHERCNLMNQCADSHPDAATVYRKCVEKLAKCSLSFVKAWMKSCNVTMKWQNVAQRVHEGVVE